MSGFEVIGVVLGAIPLVLEVVNKCHSAIEDNRDLNRLRQWVETECAVLRNTCERLLVSIVPNENIADYLKDLFGPLWKTGEAQAFLRLRLWTSYELFEETVQEMSHALSALKRELGRIFVRSILTQLDVVEGKKSIKDRLIEWIAFRLKKGQIEDLKKIIHDGNSTLTAFIETSLDPEVVVSRETQSRGRYLKLARQCSTNALAALETSISCQCRGSHNLNLELPLLSTYPTPADDEKEIVNGVIFNIVVSSASLDGIGKPSLPERKELELHTHVWGDTALSRAGRLPTSAEKPAKKYLKTNRVGIPPSSPELLEITDLCKEINAARKITSQIECYGIIKSDSPMSRHSFRVNSGRSYIGFSNWDGESLEKLLSSIPQNAFIWKFREKHILAAKIASSVLQLVESQWLPAFLTSAHIAFMGKADSSLFEHPFVIKQLRVNQVTYQELNKRASGLPHELLFSLGVVLLEVALGKSLDSLRRRSEISPPTADRDLLADYEIAVRHLNKVEQAMGALYSQAVRHCIKCEFMAPVLDLEEEGFRKEVYEKVVAPLEYNAFYLKKEYIYRSTYYTQDIPTRN